MTTRSKTTFFLATLLWDAHRWEVQATYCEQNSEGLVGAPYRNLMEAQAGCKLHARASFHVAELCDELRRAEGLPSVFA